MSGQKLASDSHPPETGGIRAISSSGATRRSSQASGSAYSMFTAIMLVCTIYEKNEGQMLEMRTRSSGGNWLEMAAARADREHGLGRFVSTIESLPAASRAAANSST